MLLMFVISAGVVRTQSNDNIFKMDEDICKDDITTIPISNIEKNIHSRLSTYYKKNIHTKVNTRTRNIHSPKTVVYGFYTNK